MERRLFLTGMLGLAGAAALASLAGPGKAVAGIPSGNGILDQLDKPDQAFVDESGDGAEVVQVSHRRGHHRHHRRRPRHGWRRVCRSYWHRGRRHVRCWRTRVWI